MRFFVVLLMSGLVSACYTLDDRVIEHPPGVLAPTAPIQKTLSGNVPVLKKSGFTIKPLAEFQAEARVLSKENYRFDKGSLLSPVDLALGWGSMSDSEVLRHFEISQSNRFYYWSTPAFPIPRQTVETQSANMHMIPATRAIEKQLKSIRSGNIVRFEGFLVEVKRDDGWNWRSSLTRNDIDDGSCELVWVETLEVL